MASGDGRPGRNCRPENPGRSAATFDVCRTSQTAHTCAVRGKDRTDAFGGVSVGTFGCAVRAGAFAKAGPSVPSGRVRHVRPVWANGPSRTCPPVPSPSCRMCRPKPPEPNVSADGPAEPAGPTGRHIRQDHYRPAQALRPGTPPGTNIMARHAARREPYGTLGEGQPEPPGPNVSTRTGPNRSRRMCRPRPARSAAGPTYPCSPRSAGTFSKGRLGRHGQLGTRLAHPVQAGTFSRGGSSGLCRAITLVSGGLPAHKGPSQTCPPGWPELLLPNVPAQTARAERVRPCRLNLPIAAHAGLNGRAKCVRPDGPGPVHPAASDEGHSSRARCGSVAARAARACSSRGPQRGPLESRSLRARAGSVGAWAARACSSRDPQRGPLESPCRARWACPTDLDFYGPRVLAKSRSARVSAGAALGGRPLRTCPPKPPAPHVPSRPPAQSARTVWAATFSKSSSAPSGQTRLAAERGG